MVIVILWGRIVKKYSALIGPKSAQNPSQIHAGFYRIFTGLFLSNFVQKTLLFLWSHQKLAFLWFCAISRNFYQNRKLIYFKSISFSCQKLEIFTFYVKPTDQSFPIKGQSCQIWPQLISPCCWGNISRNIPWQFY